jgi:ribosome biogenesis GTPase / thiamine phosphate phosphatase
MGERSVLIGQSGMGKSKLLNALVGSEAQRTNEISMALGSGKHTTTFTRLFTLGEDNQTWVIDSPGMQVFGLAHYSRLQIQQAFPEFRDAIGHCRFRDCKHLHEPNCALRDLINAGKATEGRLTYLRKFCGEGEAVPHYERH